MELIKRVAQLTALLLAVWFTYQFTIGTGNLSIGHAWRVFIFRFAQISLFIGTILIMVGGLVMASCALFGQGAVRVAVRILVLGVLFIVINTLEGNRNCATPQSAASACDEEFARLQTQDDNWFSLAHLTKIGFLKALEHGVEEFIGSK
jgi:hypothetical protein